ncbi:MAG: hypothetical protein ACYC18_12535, partial [Gammaproteobacteria bacterium]
MPSEEDKKPASVDARNQYREPKTSRFTRVYRRLTTGRKVVGPTMALQTVGGILSVATSIILTRALGVKNYGIYAYALSLISLLGVLA